MAKTKGDDWEFASVQYGAGYGKYVARSGCMRLDRHGPGRRSLMQRYGMGSMWIGPRGSQYENLQSVSAVSLFFLT